MKKHGFNDNWSVTVNGITYENVMLPFDAMLRSPRKPDSDNGSNTGYFAGGKYVYTKTFVPDNEIINKIVFLHFECVYQNAAVYINGQEIYFHPYGYTPFSVDITDYVECGKTTEISVEVDNTGKNSRWYSGGGIIRDVCLLSGVKEIFIKENGIKLSTDSNYNIKYEVDSEGGDINIECYGSGKLVCSCEGSSGGLKIASPLLWDEDHPYLYDIYVRLMNNGCAVEEHHIRYGIRYTELNENGLFINGKNIKLRGACVHHDNGLLGAVSIWESELRRIRILKESGFNAVRVAHQPASEYMLNACDELGIYVVDELFDMYYIHKNNNDYASYFKEWHMTDAEAMVNHDFNHPSVIMYSIGNEISETAFDEGIGYISKLAELIRKLDPDRPVTAGINFFLNYFASKGKGIYSNEDKGRIDEKRNVKKIMDTKAGSAFVNIIMNNLGSIKNIFSKSTRADRATEKAFSVLDVAGYNYGTSRYLIDRKHHPKRIILGTETFPVELAKNWNLVKKHGHLIGDFIWTGWDYIGEAGIGVTAYNYTKNLTEKEYPALLAGTGVIDILGNPRPEVYWNKLIWGMEKGPYIAVEPVNHSGEKPSHSAWRNSNAVHSYSFSDCKNKNAICYIYSDGSCAELYLNGKLMGRKKIKNYKATFSFAYEPGMLTAKSYDRNGRLIGQDELISAGNNYSINIEKENIEEYVFCNISITDENNVVHCNSDKALRVDVDGGELAAFGSANPYETEPYFSNICRTYQGRALAIIKKSGGGQIKINVTEVEDQ